MQKSISKKKLFSAEWSAAIAKITTLYFEMAFTSRADESCAPRSNVPAQNVQRASACSMVAFMMTKERTRQVGIYGYDCPTVNLNLHTLNVFKLLRETMCL